MRPFACWQNEKKVLTKRWGRDIIYKLTRGSQTDWTKDLDTGCKEWCFSSEKPLKKIWKNLLTNTKQRDIIVKLSHSRGQPQTRELDTGWVQRVRAPEKLAFWEKELQRSLQRRDVWKMNSEEAVIRCMKIHYYDNCTRQRPCQFQRLKSKRTLTQTLVFE